MTNSRQFLLAALLALPLVLYARDDDPDIRHFESLIETGQYSQAAQELIPYTADHPESWQALYQLGFVDFRLHHIQDSLTVLCKSIVLNKNMAESHKILAFDLNILGRQDLAIHELNESIRCDPANAEAHYELGRISYEQGQYQTSASELEKAKALAPDSVRNYHNLGLAYSALGETQKAVENFEQGLKLNAAHTPPSAWPLIDYATYFNMQGHFSRARDLLLQATRIDSSWDRAYSELSKAYRGLNSLSDAIAALQKAIAINANNAEYHYVLARLYTQTNHSQEAKLELAAYERFKTPLTPQNPHQPVEHLIP